MKNKMKANVGAMLIAVGGALLFAGCSSVFCIGYLRADGTQSRQTAF
jgi:hypothetical protein